MKRAEYIRRIVLGFLAALLVAGPAAAAAGPGATLRQYLQARWRGEVAAAQALWDANDLRRTEAMGTRYPGLEARFDDNLLWSATERAASRARLPAVRDSVVETAWARYTVVLPAPGAAAAADTLRYFLRKSGEEWRLTSAFAKLTDGWTTREGRYLRLHASKLRNFNKDAFAGLDSALARACKRLGTPEIARLRLERIKIEYYLCDSDAELRQLGVQPGGGAYRLAGERIVTRRLSDANAASRVLVHLTLKEVPPGTVPVLEEGLPAALGGWGDFTEGVTLQLGAALAASADPGAVLDPSAFHHAKPETAMPLAAAWSDALLRELGAERFLALYRALSAAPDRAAPSDAAAVRREIETAAGKRGAALVDWLRAASAGTQPPLAGGCTSIPEETRRRRPILRWNDPRDTWALAGFETGDTYTIVVGPYDGSTPRWAQKMEDSLAVAHGEKPAVVPEQPRPLGDPPKIALLVRERVVIEPEAYESPLFLQQFPKRRYANDLIGLIITPDEVRLYDYRRDVVAGCYAPDFALPGDPPYYDEKAGCLCFRLRRDVLPKALIEYMAVGFVYTGE